MHPVSKFALALSLGAFSMVSVAHAADKNKDKGKAEAAPQPGQNYSPEFQKAYFPIASLLADKDQKGKPIAPDKQKENWIKAKAGWPSILAAAVNDDDKATAGRFGTALGAKLKDTALMRQGVEMAFASPSLPADLKRDFGFEMGDYAYGDKNYAAAEKYRIDAYNAGYRAYDIEFKIALATLSQKKYADTIAWMDKAFAAKAAANQPVPALWYGVSGDAASNSGDTAKANVFYTQMVAAENNPKYWYAALENYRRFSHVSGEPLRDLYRLMRRTGSLSKDNYLDYIRIQERYPTEVQAVIAEGIAANKLTSAETAESTQRTQGKIAEFVSSLSEMEANARASKSGYDAMLAGDNLFSNADYAKARDMYVLALSRGKVMSNEGDDETDETTLRLGISKLYLDDIAGAKADIAKIGSGSLAPLANYWLTHINHLEHSKPAA